MKPVLEYSSYREYLRDYYLESKNRTGFTWRDFAKAAGYASPVFLKLVCDNKANLSEVGTERVAEAMGLTGVDLEYFRLLVQFDQEDNQTRKNEIFKRIRSIAGENSIEVVGEAQYDYFGNWLNPVMREIAPHVKNPTPAKLANICEFEAETKDVKKSLEFLQKAELLEKNDDGKYRQTSKALTTGPLDVASMAIREMHRQMGNLAVEALDKVPKEERDISGLTIGISERAFARLQNEIAEFRRRVSAIVMEDTGSERVYRMNLQLFPLTKKLPEGNEGGNNE